ncbi:MAG: acyl-CoA/acyl-ACP dehydrogenase [Myxococcales bacterium]|nr:acyl-CoA/acyl-ACP dehydrogenase [Myxococcales bacterium]MCB9628603.1 acyl-CoA/acyl-ACP dehydrogenase [Sandaracinaceae bacterium]
MQFKLTDDQQSIADGLKQILKGVVTDESLKALSKEGVWFHQRAWQALAEAEMLGLGLPEAHGGAGFGMLELCLLLEQVGRTVAPIPALETLVSAGLPIAQFGTDAQRARLLPGIATGEQILTAALVDAFTRDPRAPAATATRDGDGFLVSGTFTNVAYVEQAARVLLAAKTSAGVVVCLLDPKAAGVAVDTQRGTNTQPLSRLTLSNARVPASDVLGDEQSGASILDFTLQRTLVGMAALQYGVAREALIMTARYASERKQFGMPIGMFQAVKQRLGDAYIDVGCMEVTMLQAAFKLDAERDASADILTAKFWAAEGGQRVLFAAQHVHGGMGFDRDYPLFRYFLTGKHLEFTLGGANETIEHLGALLAAG